MKCWPLFINLNGFILDNIDQSSNSDVLFNKQLYKDNFLGHTTSHDREVNSDGL